MIVSTLGPDQIAYRLLTPRWAYQPLSGAGAARSGGRLNRPGVDALYLALEPETAIAEYRQDEPLMRPGTLVAYTVSLARVVDFRAGYTPAQWPAIWQDMACNWRGLAFLEEIEPPTWVIADMVRDAGIAGILFPSTRLIGGTNLVIYSDQLAATDMLTVHDPHCELPGNQLAWD